MQKTVFEKDTPIFCTGKQPFIYIKNGIIDQRETDMMSVRWNIFHFNVQIEQNVQKEIPKCPSALHPSYYTDSRELK